MSGSGRTRDAVRLSDGTTLAIQVEGTGEPLLLLPGQANNHTWWDRVRPSFARRFTTITFDWRGMGDSSDAADGYSTPGFAADAVAVLDHLGVQRAHVYGTSLGGRTAQWLAADHPERVGRLVLGCTTPGAAHGVERSDEVRRSLAQPDPDAVRRVTEDLFYTPAWRAGHPGPYATSGDPSASRRARAGHLRASNQHDAWDALPRITAPTLVLHGSDDLLAPVANAQLLADRIPDATAFVFPGARHGYFDEYAADATPLALAHLAG